MKKCYLILHILLFIQGLSETLLAQSIYYINQGNTIIKVDNGDPEKLVVIEWQVRLYKRGAFKTGNTYWGTIHGSTDKDVMAKLKRSQDFELNFSAFIGKGRVRDAVFTYFNFLGPIAIVHESKPEEKPVEGFDEYLDIIKRAQDYYNVFIGVKKKLKGILRPSTPFDHVGELFIDYTNNLKQVFENTDKLKNLLLSNVDNKFEKINSDISNIDKGFQKADKIYTEIQFNISLPDTTNKDSSNSSSANSFYVFFTAGIKIMPEPGRFSGLRSSTTLYIISAPVFHIGILTDPMQDEKVSFFSDIEKKFAGNKAVLDQLSHNNVSSLIEVHYGKPYSTTVLKTAVDGFDAIEAFKKSTQELYAGLAEIDFLLLK